MSVINSGASSMYPEIRSQIPKSLGGFAPEPPPGPARPPAAPAPARPRPANPAGE